MPRRPKRRIFYENDLKKELDISWHTLELEKLCINLDTNIETVMYKSSKKQLHWNKHYQKGLTQTEAKNRLTINGRNALTPIKTTPEILKIIKIMFHGFALLLWAGAICCLIIYFVNDVKLDKPNHDNLTLGIGLLLVIFITGILSYYQKLCRSQLMQSFKNLTPQYATVLRENEYLTIPSEELVVGDIVEIKYGDRVPADLRIIEARNLKVDNSCLTGDSDPQMRSAEFTHENPLETRNLVFFFTNIIEGKAKGIVVACGDDTVMGRITHLVTSIEKFDSPMTKELKYLIRIIMYFAIFMGIIFFILSLLVGCSYTEAIVFLIGMIVANVPEGLLATVTVCLTLTAKRMSKQNCYAKNIESIETLGATSIICTDKTGTLTQNRMTVSHLWINNSIIEADTSEMWDDMHFDTKDATFRAIVLCATLCNSAEIKGGQQEKPVIKKEISGNASDAALLKFSELITGKTRETRRMYHKVMEIPFNSNDKFQLTIHSIESLDNDCNFLLFMKGAPERILEHCVTIFINGRDQGITNEIRNNYQETYSHFGGMGERVLGFCDYALPSNEFDEDYDFTTQPTTNFPLFGFRFLGLISMIDPPRATVPNAVAKCRTAGIKVIMVTGDHSLTAKSIAKSVGIITQPTIEEIALQRQTSMSRLDPFDARACIVHGAILRQLSGYELDIIISQYSEIVFVRTTPQQKLLIVESCQRNGHVVAVSGNGVNDAPALRRANVSISLAIAGSDVSRQASDIILLDDNFASIVVGIEEGRLIYDNLKKSIAYILTSNMPETTAFWVFLTLGVPLPLSIIAILCIDLGTDLLPAISLAYEKPETDIMQRSPRVQQIDSLVNSKLIFMTYFQIGVIQAAAGLFSYFAVMSEYGFYPKTLYGLRATWYNSNINDVKDSFGQQWTYHERKNLEYTCHTAYFVAIVVVQWANLIICKTRRNSIVQQGMRNHLLNFALIFETLAAIFLSYCPGMKDALHMFPLKLHWWFYAIPFSLIIFIYDESLRFFIRRYPNSWIQREIYY